MGIRYKKSLYPCFFLSTSNELRTSNVPNTFRVVESRPVDARNEKNSKVITWRRRRSHTVLTFLSALGTGRSTLMMIMMGAASASIVIVSAVLSAGLEMFRCFDWLPVHPCGATVNQFLIIFDILTKAARLRWLSWQRRTEKQSRDLYIFCKGGA